MSRAEYAIELAIGVVCGVVTYYQAAGGAWKKMKRLRRRLTDAGRFSMRGGRRVVADDLSGVRRRSC